MLKPALAALERGRRSVREQLGRTAIAYVVLGVALLLICVPIARITRRASQAPTVEEAPRPG